MLSYTTTKSGNVIIEQDGWLDSYNAYWSGMRTYRILLDGNMVTPEDLTTDLYGLAYRAWEEIELLRDEWMVREGFARRSLVIRVLSEGKVQ